jgi:hypothetical protein
VTDKDTPGLSSLLIEASLPEVFAETILTEAIGVNKHGQTFPFLSETCNPGLLSLGVS